MYLQFLRLNKSTRKPNYCWQTVRCCCQAFWIWEWDFTCPV